MRFFVFEINNKKLVDVKNSQSFLEKEKLKHSCVEAENSETLDLPEKLPKIEIEHFPEIYQQFVFYNKLVPAKNLNSVFVKNSDFLRLQIFQLQSQNLFLKFVIWTEIIPADFFDFEVLQVSFNLQFLFFCGENENCFCVLGVGPNFPVLEFFKFRVSVFKNIGNFPEINQIDFRKFKTRKGKTQNFKFVISEN